MIKKLFTGFIAAIFISCGSASVNIPETETNVEKPDVNKIYKSVVKISVKTIDGLNALVGSGFAIDGDHIMTAGHVCQSIYVYQAKGKLEKDISIFFYGPDEQTILESKGASIKYIDMVHDICVMQKSKHGLIPLKFADNYWDTKVHSRVYIVGAPKGYFATTYSGEVIYLNKDINAFMIEKLITSAASAPGNSGSPVLNKDGKVIGMLIAGYSNFNNLSICTPSYILVRFLMIVGVIVI